MTERTATSLEEPRPVEIRSDSETPLVVEGLTVSYPTDSGDRVIVLDDVGFELRSGETLALVGESGSGKSMTAMSILRLHESSGGRIDRGSIRYFGRELTDLPDAAMGEIRGGEIAMIFQDPAASLDPAFTVGRQISSVLIRHTGIQGREAKARAVELLGEVGITEPARRVDQYPHEFSGGMCQRVMIAMALSCRPKVLLADEPTTALDVTTQAQIVELLRRLSAEFKMSTIFTSHDLGLVSENCDRVGVMYAGQLVELGTLDEVFSGPEHPYTQALLDCSREPAARGEFAPIAGQPPNLLQLPSGCRFHPRCTYVRDACRDTEPLLRILENGRCTRCMFSEVIELPGVTG